MIKVTYMINGEYQSAIYTKDTLRLWMTDPHVVEIMDMETGEMLFYK